MIDVRLLSEEQRVILVSFSGEVTLQEAEGDRRFGTLIKGFGGEPFRVLCDFTEAKPMSDQLTSLFLSAQSFALKSNMKRDAFVTLDLEVRNQFRRIARQTGRFQWLGPLRFFDTVEAAKRYLLS